jgi:hypothetical protein
VGSQHDDASVEPRDNANSESRHKARGSRLIVKDVGLTMRHPLMKKEPNESKQYSLGHLSEPFK